MGFNVAFLFYPCLKAEWEPNCMEALNKTLKKCPLSQET